MEEKKSINLEIMNKEILYFSYPKIVFQEVPNEISLALSISGCPLKCVGCHSSFTWKSDFGDELTDNLLEELIKKHKHITCVLFYGGEWKEKRLIELLKLVRLRNLKTCLYTGLDSINQPIKECLDYLKTGRFIKSLGGLNSKTTNQRFFDLRRNVDISNLFIK